jgi:hypothetical protein
MTSLPIVLEAELPRCSGFVIVDRQGLEGSAGGFYGAPERALESLLKIGMRCDS